MASLTPQATLRAASGLARQRPSDPEALAGAADVIAVVGGMGQAPDPLRSFIATALGPRYLKGADRPRQRRSPLSEQAAHQLYLQARDTKDLDVVAAPTAVVLQLYRQALARDEKGKLPYLRLRLYLLQVAFEPDEASRLLEELKGREARNAVVPLERARRAFLLEDDPHAGSDACREAVRLPEFSRSYLVAIPAALRNVFRFQRGLREWVKQAWPGYAGLLGTLQEAQRAQPEAAVQMELRLLRLKLADLLCRAPDYADQAEGVHEKSQVLGELLALGNKLSAEQRALIEAQQEAHVRTFAQIPRTHNWVVLSTRGLRYKDYPQLGPSPIGDEGPSIIMLREGPMLFAPYLGRPAQR